MAATGTNPHMSYNFLGNSGLKVSNICLGTLTFGTYTGNVLFGNPRQSDEELSHKILDKFAEVGGNFIDTADVYSFGNSEKIVGTWLQKQDRNQMVIATKGGMWLGDVRHPNLRGLSRRHLTSACTASLKRLQTDYIDLYQAHIWDNGTPIEETLRTLDDLVRCGKIRYYGYSSLTGWQMQKVVDTAARLGLHSCISLQQKYSLLQRDSEHEAFAVCRNEGVGVITWGSLNAGLLTSKFKRREELDPTGSRIAIFSEMGAAVASAVHTPYWPDVCNNDKCWTIKGLLTEMAEKHGKSQSQVALRWLLQKDAVASVIVGATSVAQIEDNVGASVGWRLSDDEMKALDELSTNKPPHPYEITWGPYCNGPAAGRYNRFNKGSLVPPSLHAVEESSDL